jgi:hypothetical protein
MRFNVLVTGLLLGAVVAPAATLNNLYFGFDRGYSMYWWFLPDGRIMTKLPTTGVTPQDFASACQPAPQFCGTYTLSGDKLTVTLNNGTPRVWPVQVQKDGLMLSMIPMTVVGKYPAGTRLNGTWNKPFSSTFATSGTSVASVTSPTLLTFKPDGTYGQSTMTGLSTSSAKGADANNMQTFQVAGTYTIQDNVLMMVKDGKSERHFIAPAVGDRLAIDGQLYSKQK